jgi:signal transduction histidine kinase
MSDGVTIHDLQFNITTHNPAMERFLPGKSIDLKRCYEVIHGTKEPPTFCPMLKTVPSGETASCDFYEPNLDKYLTVRTDPIFDENDEITNVVHIVRDITERKLLEKNLREANETKDKFFSILAHDLRNPIGSLMNMNEFLLKMLDNYTKDELLENLVLMHKTSKSLYNLLEDLLTWARMQTGRIKYDPEQSFLRPIVSEIADLFSGAAKQKNISIDIDVPEDITAYIDVEMITTVIRNLVSNAVKFTKDGGKIVIRATQDSDMIHVSVVDDGIGMCDADIERLFRLDVHHTTKGTNEEKGTGLGLIMCKEFVEKNGGKIECSSTLGNGSVFTFKIPKNPPK